MYCYIKILTRRLILKSKIKNFGLYLLALLILSACATVPFTERRQLILIDPQTELALGLKARQEILNKAKTCKDPQIVNMVNKVGWRIAKATGKTDLPWEFTVIEDPKTANAFCLPGGKVFV